MGEVESRTLPLGKLPLLAFAVTVLVAMGAALWSSPSASADECPPGLNVVDGGQELVEGTECADLIVATEETVEIESGEGDDVVIGDPAVESIDAGTGDDTIYTGGATETFGGYGDDIIDDSLPGVGDPVDALAGVRASAISEQAVFLLAGDPAGTPCENANDPIVGDENDNNMRGGRGNDWMCGRNGNDYMYGGIGDDHMFGGGGDDVVAGGLGGDDMDGNNGSDVIRGDGTIDRPVDTGGTGQDTLSYATAVTPGFNNADGNSVVSGITNFPGTDGERGVYINLQTGAVNNGAAANGGGTETVANPGQFERVLGSPYADVIIGSGRTEVIHGGGGPDVIRGNGGGDSIRGDAGGDNIDSGGWGVGATINGGPGIDYCLAVTLYSCNESGATGSAVQAQNWNRIRVGFMTNSVPASGSVEMYVTGSTGDWVTTSGAETINVAYDSANRLVFVASPDGMFSSAEQDQTTWCDYSEIATWNWVVCEVPAGAKLSSIVLDGQGSNDQIHVNQNDTFQYVTSPILLGGQGSDVLQGSPEHEDLLVDGPGAGNDILYGMGMDDGLINNEGQDDLYGHAGDDLIMSPSVCDGDLIDGGNGDDNASWAKYQGDGIGSGVGARLIEGVAGRPGGSGPQCAAEGGNSFLATLIGIEDLEGSSQNDGLHGDNQANNLLGRDGNDDLFGYGGVDGINARDGAADDVNCGAGDDRPIQLDYVDPNPVDCDGNAVRDNP